MDPSFGNLATKTCPALKELCKSRGLSMSGTKKDLIQRLQRASSSCHPPRVPAPLSRSFSVPAVTIDAPRHGTSRLRTYLQPEIQLRKMLELPSQSMDRLHYLKLNSLIDEIQFEASSAADGLQFTRVEVLSDLIMQARQKLSGGICPCGQGGLVTSQNACFMNAALQVLKKVLGLRFYKASSKTLHSSLPPAALGLKTRLVNAVSDFIGDSLGCRVIGKMSAVLYDPINIRNLSGRLNAEFLPASMHDACEYLEWLMEFLKNNVQDGVAKVEWWRIPPAASVAQAVANSEHLCPEPTTRHVVLQVLRGEPGGKNQTVMELPEQLEETNFRLMGVAQHHGDSWANGHWTSSACHDGMWFSFDNATVRRTAFPARSHECCLLVYSACPTEEMQRDGCHLILMASKGGLSKVSFIIPQVLSYLIGPRPVEIKLLPAKELPQVSVAKDNHAGDAKLEFSPSPAKKMRNSEKETAAFMEAGFTPMALTFAPSVQAPGLRLAAIAPSAGKELIAVDTMPSVRTSGLDPVPPSAELEPQALHLRPSIQPQGLEPIAFESNPKPVAMASIQQRLQQIKDLFEMGLLTPEVYSAKQADIVRCV